MTETRRGCAPPSRVTDVLCQLDVAATRDSSATRRSGRFWARCALASALLNCRRMVLEVFEVCVSLALVPGAAVTIGAAAFGLVMLQFGTRTTCRYPKSLTERLRLRAVVEATKEYVAGRGAISVGDRRARRGAVPRSEQHARRLRRAVRARLLDHRQAARSFRSVRRGRTRRSTPRTISSSTPSWEPCRLRRCQLRECAAIYSLRWSLRVSPLFAVDGCRFAIGAPAAGSGRAQIQFSRTAPTGRCRSGSRGRRRRRREV